MASIDKVLTNYFKQLHFNAMSPEVRARWAEYMKLPDLTWSMKDWKNQLMQETAPDSGVFVNKDLPNIMEELTDDQIKDLYKYMNAAVSGMAEDKKLNNAEFVTAKAFVDDFYGTFKLDDSSTAEYTNIFNVIKVTADTQDMLNKIIKEPDGALNVLKAPVEQTLKQIGGEKKLTFEKLVDKIKKGDYDKDSTFREQLIILFENIENYAPYSWLEYSAPDGSRPNKEALDNFIGTIKEKLINGLKPEPSNDVIERFKNNYAEVLERIYKKPKVKALFAEHDEHGIIAALDTARDEVNYDVPDQPNYLYPKVDKQLNVPQRLKKRIDDFYENNLEKYFNNFGGDRLFKSKPARDIVKGITKSNIKRTEGLDAILNNADKIKKEIKYESTSTGTHFEWFLKEMQVIKEADDKAFGACLSNGISLRGVVQRLIMDAVSAGKISEAKTALEILSVIKYENTTSKTLDAIKADKDLFVLFSESSVNTNEWMKFITGALDKTIRVAGIALATMASFGVNSVRKLGSKIRTENKHLAAAHNAKLAENESGKKALQEKIDKAKQNQSSKQKEYDDFVRANGDEKKLESDVSELSKQEQEMMAKVTPQLQGMQEFIESGEANEKEQNAYNVFVQAYQACIEKGIPIPDEVYNAMPEKIKYFTDEIQVNLKPDIVKRLNGAQDKRQKFIDAKNALESAGAELAANQKKIDSWDKDHKDKYQELIDYWNQLEFGRDMHLGRVFGGMYSRFGNKKAQQEKFFAKFNNGIPPR